MKKLEATNMWYLRMLMEISLTDRKTNDVVLQLAGVQSSFTTTIRKWQMKF